MYRTEKRMLWGALYRRALFTASRRVHWRNGETCHTIALCSAQTIVQTCAFSQHLCAKYHSRSLYQHEECHCSNNNNTAITNAPVPGCCISSLFFIGFILFFGQGHMGDFSMYIHTYVYSCSTYFGTYSIQFADINTSLVISIRLPLLFSVFIF